MPTKEIPYRGPTFHGHSFDYKVNGTVTSGVYRHSDPLQRTCTVQTGESPPDWRRRIIRGQYAGSTLTGTAYRVTNQSNCEYTGVIVPAPTSGTSNYRVDRSIPISYYPSDYSYPSTSMAAASNATGALDEAKRHFLRKLIAHQRSFSGGVALGELRETLRMIKSPARGLRRAVDTWHRKAMKLRARETRSTRSLPQSKRAPAIRRALGDSWLENAFGWQPLLNDIDDGAKALARINHETFGLTTIEGRGSSSGYYGTPFEGELIATWARITRLVEKELEADVRLHGKAKANVGNPRLMKARLLGFSVQDFVPTLWELTPWSFLIDYFVNVGEVLEGWSWGTTGLVWCEYNGRRTGRYVISYVPRANVNTILSGVRNGRLITETVLLSRYRYLGSFTPSLTWRIPGLGSQKWLNIAALGLARSSERRYRL